MLHRETNARAEMATRSTEIKFKGTLAFTDVNAAQRLVALVNDMLDRSMDVFWKVRCRERSSSGGWHVDFC